MAESSLFARIPLFAGSLVFLNACGDSGATADPTAGDGATTGPDTTTGSSSSGALAESGQMGSEASTGSSTSSAGSASSTDVTSSAESGSETGQHTCESCSAELPAGWLGPIAYAHVTPGSSPPTCGSDMLESGPHLFAGLAPPAPAACECSCTTDEDNVSCNRAVYTGAASGEAQCHGSYYGIYNDDCMNVSVDGEIQWYAAAIYGFYYACNPQSSQTLAEISWASEIATCYVSPTSSGCDDGKVCMPPLPEGFEAKWCLYKDGDRECPAGTYSEKTVFWRGVDDTRRCSSCYCGPESGGCEATELLIYPEADCMGTPVAALSHSEQCVDATGGSIRPVSTPLVCGVTQMTEPQGEAVPTDPVTLCCSE